MVFSVPTWQILNALERQVVLISLEEICLSILKKYAPQAQRNILLNLKLSILKKFKTGCAQGYRVVTSSGVVTGHGKHDNR